MNIYRIEHEHPYLRAIFTVLIEDTSKEGVKEQFFARFPEHLIRKLELVTED